MFVLLLLAIAGILWLSHRFKLLLQLPIESSMRSLLIPIPTVPLISVNKITDSTVFLHWDSYVDDDKKELNPNSISHFILYINGIQSNVINGKQQSCTIENLTPSTNYQIDLVAFNVSGYKSRSSPIFIKTSFKKVNSIKDEGLNYPDSIIKNLLDDDELKSVVMVDNFKSRSRSGSLTELPGSTNNNITSNNTHNNKLVHVNMNMPHLTSDINELKWMLETALGEYNALLVAHNEASVEFKDEELNLLATRNEAKERRRYEDTSKASLRQEIKLLEEQKLKANTRFNKDEKKLEEKKLKIVKQKEEIIQWETKIEEMKREAIRFKQEKPKLIEKYQREIEELNKITFTNFSNFHEIENDLKTEINNRKQVEVTKKKLELLVKQLPNCFNSNTGLYNAEGIEIIESIIKLFPKWGEKLRDELIIKDQDIFNLWKNNEDELIRNAKGGASTSQSQSISITTPSPPLQPTLMPSNSLGHVLNPTNSGSIGSQQMFNVSPDLQFASMDQSHKRIPSNNSWGNSDWSVPNINVNDQSLINLLGDNLFSTPNQINSSPNLTNPLSGYDYSGGQQVQQQQTQSTHQAPSITSITALSNNAKNLMHKTSNGSLGGLLLDGLQTSPLQLAVPQSAPQSNTDWSNNNSTSGMNSFSYVENGGSRGRSGSNRTIWSNNNSILTNNGSLNGTTNGGIHNLLKGSMQISTEPYYPTPTDNNDNQTASDDDRHSNSFSLKSKIFKFGMSSPHKTISNKTTNTNEDELITDEEVGSHKHSKSADTSSSNGGNGGSGSGNSTGGGFLANGLTTTSRFFKKHKLSTGSSTLTEPPIEQDEERQNLTPLVEPTSGLRKLSLFAKNDKRNL